MKKFILFYTIFSVIMLVGIYYFTLTQETNKRVQNVFFDFAKTFKETKDFESFMRFQVVAYDHLETVETEQYDIFLFASIATNENNEYNQFAIYVMPKTDVKYAKSIDDDSDLTGIIIKDIDQNYQVLLSTKTDEKYKNHGLSHGIASLGFYYYVYDFEKDLNVEIELTDYHGNPIVKHTVNLQYLNRSTEGLTFGFDASELSELLRLKASINPIIVRSITIYLLVDILLGGAIYIFVKRKSM